MTHARWLTALLTLVVHCVQCQSSQDPLLVQMQLYLNLGVVSNPAHGWWGRGAIHQFEVLTTAMEGCMGHVLLVLLEEISHYCL